MNFQGIHSCWKLFRIISLNFSKEGAFSFKLTDFGEEQKMYMA